MDNAHLLRQLMQTLKPYLDAKDVRELVINRPGELFYDGPEGWCQVIDSKLHAAYLTSLVNALISFNGLGPGPILSVVFPDGERGQIISAPACAQNGLSITIRKARNTEFSLLQLSEQGLFANCRHLRLSHSIDALALCQPEPTSTNALLSQLLEAGDYLNFLEMAVQNFYNIAIVGKTKSGKTTLARALMSLIPTTERLVLIEDIIELNLPQHPNKVQLQYGTQKGRVSAEACITASLRLSPDRILLGELRGAEAWEYLVSINTGHPGSITTFHANSATSAFDRLALMIKQSDAGRQLDYPTILAQLRHTIPIVLFMDDKRVKEFYFSPVVVAV